ncbi:MAG TPA: hypothetical protein ENG18_01420, partial [Nitrososphaeria archaeon]|nr:hypothetical protein [Nitrososphaeria archaeon]
MSVYDFEALEEKREKFLRKIKDLVSYEQFDEERWERLKELVYDPMPLNVDVVIDDCTLREGLQMAGLLTPRPEEYLKIALMLREIGVERLEVMIYAKSDKEAVKLMKDHGLGDILAAWCRANRKDLDQAIQMDFKQVGISH